MPLRLYRYMVARFLVTFLASIAVFTALLLMDQASRQVDQLAPHSRGLVDFVLSFSLLAPPLLSYSLPLAFLMAMITCLEQMKRDRELQAVQGAGVSPQALFWPFLALALAVFALVTAVSTVLGPASLRLYNNRLNRIAREKFLAQIRPYSFFKGIPGTVLVVGSVDAMAGDLGGLVVAQEGEGASGDLILARNGTLRLTDEGEMVLTLAEGSIHPLSASEHDYHTGAFDRLLWRTGTVTADPVVTGRQVYFAAGMTELARISRAGAASGDVSKATEAAMEYHRRFALPSLLLLYPFLVFPLAVSTGRLGRAAAFTSSIALFFVSYLIYSVGSVLGTRGWLSPPAASWLAPAVFAAASLTTFGFFLWSGRSRSGRDVKRAGV